MRFVSPLLKHAVYPALHHTGWLGRIAPPGGYAVVNYHGVFPSDYSGSEPFLDGNLVRPEILRQQLQFLKTSYNIIHPEDFRAWIEQSKPLPPRAILITCDDGLLNALTDMLPVLQSENVSCLFFVTGASCSAKPPMLWYEELYAMMRSGALAGSELMLPPEDGMEATTTASSAPETFQSHWWKTVRAASRLNKNEREDWLARVRQHCGPLQDFSSERRWRLLNIRELKKLTDAGMTIGAHTLSHPVLSLCVDEEARREIQQSKLDIENVLGRPIWAFAYPFGNSATMGDREVRLAQQASFSCAFLNVEHWGAGASDPFAITRTHVSRDTGLPELSAHLSGLHLRLQRAVGT